MNFLPKQVLQPLAVSTYTVSGEERIVNESFYEIANRLRAVAEAKAESQQVEFQQAESAEHAETPMDEQGITEREAEGLNITEHSKTLVDRQWFHFRITLMSGSIDLQQRAGINVERILPEGFQNTTAIRTFPPPIVRQCLEAEGADQQFIMDIICALFWIWGSKAIASHPFLRALTLDIRKENDWQEMVKPFLMRLAADDQQKEQTQTMETELANLVANLANTYVERNKVPYALANLKRTHQQRQANEDEINNQIRMTKSNKRHILRKIAESKQQVANTRQQLYIICQKTPREDELTVQSGKQIIGFEFRELEKVEEFQLTPVALERFRFSGTDNGLVVMTDTVKLSLERFRFHLRLYDASIDGETYTLRENEERFLYPEERSFKRPLRDFYYSDKIRKFAQSHELQKKRHYAQLCAKERKYITSQGNQKPVMFVGDRGYGTGSTIKGHGRYVLHPVAVVMKNNQTEIRTNRGSFLCVNPDGVSVRSSMATHSRDTISAHAIALSGIGTLLFGVTFPAFDPKAKSRESRAFHRCCTAFECSPIDRLLKLLVILAGPLTGSLTILISILKKKRGDRGKLTMHSVDESSDRSILIIL
ncbi:MAG: hypothetical protein EXX96DRAFT_624240 [Benjaminiella poitrasii]|nr:MAG: hypothetical protein EXX96DRAFT_624240 [Benjaminiella poitrasii]